MTDIGHDGDLLDDVRGEGALFANAAWQVLADGLEHRDTGYFIARETLAARRPDGLWNWPLHLAEKSWCAPRAFREAFLAAATAFGFAADPALSRSFAIGFGTRAPATGGSDAFVALADLVRPRPVAPTARKRPVVPEGRPVPRARVAARPPVPARAEA